MKRAAPLTLPGNRAAIDDIVRRCRRQVTKRALMSAGVVIVPIPGLDIAADLLLLRKLIDEINTEFGLAPAQIERLSPATRVLVYKSIVAFGGAMVGRAITKEILVKALAMVGMRISVKQATKYVPIAGQAVSAVLSYTAMRYVALQHIRDCERVVAEVLGPA